LTGAHGLFRFVGIAEAFGEKDFDAAGRDVNAGADVLGERDEEFTGWSVNRKEWRAGLGFAREEDVANFAEKRGGFRERTGRRRNWGWRNWKFEDGAAD